MFHETEIQIQKSQSQVLEWTPDRSRRLAPWEISFRPHFLRTLRCKCSPPCLSETAIPVQTELLHVEDGLKTLGEMSSPHACWDAALQKLQQVAHDGAVSLRQKMPRDIAVRFVQTAVFMKCRYGIKWASLSQQQVETAMAPVWKAYKATIATPVSTSTAALKAFGFGNFWYELNTDRLITFIRLLSSKGEHSTHSEKMIGVLAIRGQWWLLHF